MTIRSSSLVNDATGVKIFKEGLGPVAEGRPGEPKKRSTQAEKIAAAAAAVGPGRGRGRKPEAKGPSSDKRPNPNQGPRRDGGKPAAPRNNGGPGREREPKPAGRRGEPRRDGGKPREPALKDRLDYYKSKYGEDFKPSHVEEKSSKPGLLGKIAGIFGLGKKKGK